MNSNAAETVSERRTVNRKRSATRDLAKRDPLSEDQMDPTWPVWTNSSNRIEMLSSNASQLSLSGRGDAIMTTVYVRNVTFRF